MERTAKNRPLRWLHIILAVFFAFLSAVFGNITLHSRACYKTYANASQAAEPLMDDYIQKTIVPIETYFITTENPGEETDDEFLLSDDLRAQNTNFRFVVSSVQYVMDDGKTLVDSSVLQKNFDTELKKDYPVWTEKHVYFPLHYVENDSGVPKKKLGEPETDLNKLNKMGTPARIQLDCYVVDDPQISDAFSRIKRFFPYAQPLAQTGAWLVVVSLALCVYFIIRCFMLAVHSADAGKARNNHSILFSIPPDLFLVATLPLAVVLEVYLIEGMDTLIQPQNLLSGNFLALLTFPAMLTGLFVQLFLFFLLMAFSAGSGHLRYCFTVLRFEEARITRACFFGYVAIQIVKCVGLGLLLNLFHEGKLPGVEKWLAPGWVLLIAILLEKAVALPVLYRCIREVRAQMNRAARFVSGDLTDASSPVSYKTFAEHAADVHSITERISISAGEYIQSNKFKAELITNLSHDIKTPLTAITMYAELLQKPSLTREQRLQYLDVLKRHSARMSKLVEDLTSVSDLQSGNIKVNLDEVDLCSIIPQAVQGFEERLQKKGLQVRWDFPQAPSIVMADARLLWRVVDNMMNNICKYAKDHTTVEIGLQVYPTEVTAVFRNVSAFELHMSGEELMTRFVRGDASRHTEGSGLGLSIAQSLMELQNGCLVLETEPNLYTARLIFPQKK